MKRIVSILGSTGSIKAFLKYNKKKGPFKFNVLAADKNYS